MTAFLKRHYEHVCVFTGTRADAFPLKAYRLRCDICISYMSPWIIPQKFLSTVKKFAINFHPGTPDYRGIGCTNFAIYDNVTRYGVTAHLMTSRVDSGPIVSVKYFPVSSEDSLVDVTRKCYELIPKQFREVFRHYIRHGELPRARETWGRRLYTRKELDELCRIHESMDAGEVGRRVRATDFPDMPKAYMEAFGFRFEFKGRVL
ncbi:MAG: formyltransferase family protein [Candidatus Omnitrophota bacterium]